VFDATDHAQPKDSMPKSCYFSMSAVMPLSRVSPAHGHSYHVDYLLLIFGCLGLALLVVRKERQRSKDRPAPSLRPKAEESATPAHAADSIGR
jgi:hypothetical protein